MRKIGLPYVGPGAWLVGLNLLICWAALVPCFLEGLSLLSVISIRYIGGFSIFSAMFTLIVLAAIGKARYVVCAPVLLARAFGFRPCFCTRKFLGDRNCARP
jgi:hypothetical protein